MGSKCESCGQRNRNKKGERGKMEKQREGCMYSAWLIHGYHVIMTNPTYQKQNVTQTIRYAYLRGLVGYTLCNRLWLEIADEITIQQNSNNETSTPLSAPQAFKVFPFTGVQPWSKPGLLGRGDLLRGVDLFRPGLRALVRKKIRVRLRHSFGETKLMMARTDKV